MIRPICTGSLLNELLLPTVQVGISLRPRHASSLVYASVKCPDSRNFDVFHAMIQTGALQYVEQGRRAGECTQSTSRASQTAVYR